MPDTPLSIFISYSHADSAFADQLETDLRKQGFETWMDRQRLAGGQRWRRELQEAVEQAQVLLIVLSPDAIDSLSVQVEFDYALELSKLLIPVYYRQCNVPMELRAIQWIDFRHSYEQGIAALLQALHSQQESATPQASTQENKSSPLAEPASQNVPDAVPNNPLSNLPAQLTPLIGRQQEIQAVCALVRQPELRLVTLTGVAGIGKTRLALRVATDLLEQFPDGVFLVPLAPVSDQEQVVPTISHTLSISDSSSQRPFDRLKAALTEKQLLLLLDNFEQVVKAAVVVADLLAACPRLTVLVTSRTVLHLRGEHEFVVPPLSVPNPKRLPALPTLSQYEAVALFMQRAQAVKPEFELTPANASAVASMCVRLDGLPLAIELAATRIKYFPPQALLTRLEQGLSVLSGGARDLPARQQTLRGAIAWSYDLLTPEEQLLFRRLSVFVDGCTVQAAAQVCTAAGPVQIDILEGLLSLVDKSLLRQEESTEDEPRFLMLQVLREFGREALAASGERESTRRAHAAYYLALAEGAEPELKGPEGAVWLNRLEQEHDNLRAALAWSLEQAEDKGAREDERSREIALRFGGALLELWRVHGPISEGRNFLERALAESKSVRASVRAKARITAAILANMQADNDRAEALAGESLALYRELEDTPGIALSVRQLAAAANRRGNFAAARSLNVEALALFREAGDNDGAARSLYNLAWLAINQGEYARGRALLEESLALHRELGNKWAIALSLWSLAFVFFASQDDQATVPTLLEESLALSREVGYKEGIAFSLILAGRVALSQGNAATANSLAEQSLVLTRELGTPEGLAESLLLLARVATVQGDHVAARARYEQCLSIVKEANDKGDIALYLLGLAEVIAAQGELVWASWLWGAAEALREVIAAPIPPVERAAYEQAVAAVRSQLSEEAFAAAWQEGRMMKLEQVIDTVLKGGDAAGKQ
jgi:predicted ATPase